MHYLAFLQLEGFYVRTLQSAGVRAANGLVIHREKRVIDADSVARERKVAVGQSLAEARALAEGASFITFDPEAYRAAQTEWLTRCAQATHRLEPADFHTAFLDLSLHPDPLRVLRNLTEILPPFRVGLGRSRWVAEVAVEFDRPDQTSLYDALFVADLSVHRLLPATPEERDRLHFLGYRTIGDVAQIPLEVLRAQFGESAHRILSAAKGGGDAQVHAQWPPRSVSAFLAFDGPPECESVLREGLKALASDAAEELDRRDLRGDQVILHLETETGIETRQRTFTKSLQSIGSIYTAISLTLGDLPQNPILSITLRLPELKPARRVQLELEGNGRSRRDAEAVISAAFQHVRTVFGDGAIQVASQVVEPRRKRVLKAWRDVTGWS